MSAGDTPAVLFYLLDRYALLAMTMGTKCVFLNSLTAPSTTSTPLRRGELGLRPVAELGPLHWRGGRIPGPARPVAWVVSPGGHYTPPPDGLTTVTPPPWNHPRKLCLRGARCGGGHFRTRRFVFYSIAQGCSNSYVPVASVYDTPTGAYIIHDPPGLDARQLVAVPADE